ncbi:hypothetical protein KSF_050010 [Reticulibacter mediterranei]|uniref:Uncharacterized protein n=1 Tax=Reticulibacter mediterranei TaxID=2778369 RepID=A0A8J3IJP4_9CHLR|nr:hypothetical protein [Reticulibacter mediterranei]GHO94953.1 hypothetical protein KSF_050010 [Reticulibacter mediterranei]
MQESNLGYDRQATIEEVFERLDTGTVTLRVMPITETYLAIDDDSEEEEDDDLEEEEEEEGEPLSEQEKYVPVELEVARGDEWSQNLLYVVIPHIRTLTTERVIELTHPTKSGLLIAYIDYYDVATEDILAYIRWRLEQAHWVFVQELEDWEDDEEEEKYYRIIYQRLG